ncbi:GNAT family N-acetyltransferase [Gynuella sp.]|uniref:GNAT family N-acetyltransferase n=1 Tax=Gynuella sp. TaxID=2969146 RepID=UPI003D148DF2
MSSTSTVTPKKQTLMHQTPDQILDKLFQLQQPEVSADERYALMLSMRKWPGSYQLTAPQIEKTVALARYLSDWPLLLRLHRLGLWQASAVEISLIEAQMGFYTRALKRLDGDQRQDAQAARHNIQQCLDTLPLARGDLRCDEISLTPLACHHVSDFSWQYADPQIARLCNLPVFQSAQHWIGWLHVCQQEVERRLFAVIHDEYGFIGSVSILVYEGIGFFYYWIGKDFQRSGYGPKAVRILIRVARQNLKMNCCYAKVFSFNVSSSKAIRKLEFRSLRFRALPPSEQEVFYYSGPVKSESVLYRDLASLLDKMNSGILLEPFSQK